MEKQEHTEYPSESNSEKNSKCFGRIIEQKNDSPLCREFSFEIVGDEENEVNVMQFENRLFKQLLDYGKLLEDINENFFYLDMGLSSFQEFLVKKSYYSEICFLAHDLFCHVREIRQHYKKENVKNSNPNQCPECGANLVHQGGCLYCPLCGYSRCG